MAIYWLTPDFKVRTFKLCVLSRWDFNFCVRSSPLRGPHTAGAKNKQTNNNNKNPAKACLVWMYISITWYTNLLETFNSQETVAHCHQHSDKTPCWWRGKNVIRFGLAVRRSVGNLHTDPASNPLWFIFLCLSCCVWTLSCEMGNIAAHLSAEQIYWWYSSISIVSLLVSLHT